MPQRARTIRGASRVAAIVTEHFCSEAGSEGCRHPGTGTQAWRGNLAMMREPDNMALQLPVGYAARS